MADRLLRHIGQHRIGTAKCDHRDLAEEHPLLNKDMAGTKPPVETHDRGQPQHGADDGRPQGAAVRRRRTMTDNAAIDDALLTGSIGAITTTIDRHSPQQGGQRRPKDDERKRHPEHKTGEKSRRGDHDEASMPQNPAGKTPERRHHDGQDGRLDAKEDRGHRHRLLVADIQHAERQHDQRPGQDKQHTGDDTTPHPVQQPSEIDGELLRLRTRKQHAEIQRMQETPFADPFQLLNQQAVHYRDLPGRPTKTEQADFQPDKKGPVKADMRRSVHRYLPTGVILHLRPARSGIGRQYGRGVSG